MDDYLRLKQWLNGELGRVFEEVAAPLRAAPLLGRTHNERGPYAAAVLRIELEDEYRRLCESVAARATSAADEDDLYDEIRRYRDDEGGNWNLELEDLGRTRSLLTDAQALRDGKPENGIYHWY